MKQILPLVLALTTTACSVDSEETIPPTNDDMQIVVISFDTYSMEPITRSGIADVSNRLDVYIVSENDVQAIHQNKAEDPDTFGSISLSLNKTKTYTLYAVSHKGSGPASLEGDEFTFADNKITETFYYTTTFSPASTQSLNCQMSRIVGMFKLIVQDALPSNLAKVRFSVDNTGLAYHTAGYYTNAGEKVSVINSPSSANDGTTTFKIYCLADQEASFIDVTVTALDAEDNVIEEKSFADVPIQAGYITTFKGTFFVTTGMSFSFQSSGDWTDYDEITF